MNQAIMILTTAFSKEEGAIIAKVLVEERLAACVNIIENVHSYFIYEGAFCQEKEVQLVIKSSEENYEAIEAMIKELHSYELPEIIVLPIMKGSADYLSWLHQSC